VFAIFEQFMLNFGHGVTRRCLATGTMPVENDIFLYFWHVDGAVIRILFAVSMTKLGNFVIIIYI
jgi:hypothetical protein